jgi:phage gp46-like protein
MTDVLLGQTNDDGEVCIEGGLVELTDDFRTAAYLSLFGGNEQDDGRDDNVHTYWGNLNETDTAKRYVSETQHLLDTLPPTTGNMLRLGDAAGRDLKWLDDIGAVTEILVAVSIPALNTVKFVISINGDETVEFIENWKAAA